MKYVTFFTFFPGGVKRFSQPCAADGDENVAAEYAGGHRRDQGKDIEMESDGKKGGKGAICRIRQTQSL